MSIVNIASYKFIELADLPSLRGRLLDQCLRQGLKGTILLGKEGINLNLAGVRQGIDCFISYIHQDERFSDLVFKESESREVPFDKMVIKIKPEIVTMGIPEITPGAKRAPHISPKEFKQWLDEKRDITVLDTRNAFEVEMGSFDQAIHLNIENFRDFPNAAQQMDESLKAKPLVMFCTGGIRCEKAAVLFENYGYKEVYQLDGGILKYFEECGGAHYHGDCFVFDNRITVDEQLGEKQ